MIIDFHTHYIPKDWPDAAKDSPYWPKVEFNRQGEMSLTIGKQNPQILPEPAYRPESRFAYMDKKGIAMQILAPPPFLFCYDLPAQEGLQICRFLNNASAEVVRKWPDRFQAFGVVPLQDVPSARKEARRIVRDLKLGGITIGTSVNGKNLDDEELRGFWAEISALDVPLFLSSYGGVGSERLKKYNFNNLIGNGMELSIAGGSLIFGGVLDRFPRIKFCFSLGGGSLVAQIYRMNHGYQVLGQGTLKKKPVQYFKHFYFDVLAHSSLVLKMMVQQVGAGNLLFGSDYPFEMGDEELGKKIEEAVEDAKERNKIFYLNAARILGLRRTKKAPQR